ncbi:MAG: aldo/keto reductase [Candidatus Schekmanbacteria bacterium]|nr:aldo/keto reductase [Candidatus Schekmanbacteria bacterium]
MTKTSRCDDGGATRRQFLRLISGAGAACAAGLSTPSRADDTGAAKPVTPRSDAAGDRHEGDRVPRRKLGGTGATVPILLMGGARTFDARYDKTLHRAFKEGVDYVDTALEYAGGQSHATLAPFIEQVGDRKKLWITSKGPSDNATPEKFASDLDLCLAQLRTDYLDMYFMHYVDDPLFLAPEYLKMGDRLRRSGKTRFFGFSAHGGRVVELLEKAAAGGGIDAIMFRYNFGKYGDVELNRAMDRCAKAGIGLLAMKVQRSVPRRDEAVVGFQSQSFSLAQAKLKSVWEDERIAAAVADMENTEKLAENVAAAKSSASLSHGERRQLQQIAAATAHLCCEGCASRCEPAAPRGVRVADTLRALMYAEAYGDLARGRATYRAIPEDRRPLDTDDYAVAAGACPQRIDIGERLALARRFLG